MGKNYKMCRKLRLAISELVIAVSSLVFVDTSFSTAVLTSSTMASMITQSNLTTTTQMLSKSQEITEPVSKSTVLSPGIIAAIVISGIAIIVVAVIAWYMCCCRSSNEVADVKKTEKGDIESKGAGITKICAQSTMKRTAEEAKDDSFSFREFHSSFRRASETRPLISSPNRSLFVGPRQSFKYSSTLPNQQQQQQSIGEHRDSPISFAATEYASSEITLQHSLVEHDESYIDASLSYNSQKDELVITLKQAINLPAEWYYQVQVVLEPSKKFQYTSRYEHSKNPQFGSAKFSCNIAFAILSQSTVHFELHGRPRISMSSQLLGTATVSLSDLKQNEEMSFIAPLRFLENVFNAPENNAYDIVPFHPVGESTLSIGLQYISSSSQLIIKIGQASGLNYLPMKPIAKMLTFVKLLVMTGEAAQELLHSEKTKLCTGDAPDYYTKIKYKVSKSKLHELSLGLMVHTKKMESIGWLALGSVSPADSLEATSWAELLKAAHSESSLMTTHIYIIKPTNFTY